MKKEIFQKAFSIFSLLLFIVSIAYAKVTDTVLKQKKAVVTIYVNDKDGNRISTGTGFVVAPNGIIATNYHVITDWLNVLENALIIKMENGAYFPIEKLIDFDEDNDIALFKVEGRELPMVKLATDYKPKQGESIVVIGSPMGLETTVSDGIISNVRGKHGLIQITAPVLQGSSGSPVFNSKGEVIGVATFLVEGGQNLNFAIPAKHVARLLKDYKKPKPVTLIPETAPVPQPAPPPIPAPAPSPELQDELEKAKAEVKKNPDSALAYRSLGLIYFKLGMYQEAIGAFKQAIKIKPVFHVYYGLGFAYNMLGMYIEAIDAYKQAIRIKPDFTEAYFDLGVVYTTLGRYSDAITAFKQAIRIKPDYAEAHYNLGISYFKLKKYEEAIEAFKQAIRIKPDYVEAYVGLGHSYQNLKMYQKALEAYRQAVRIKPERAEAHYLLCSAYILSDMYSEAVEACKQAIRIKPDYADAHLLLGFGYFFLNDKGSALEQYKILKNLDLERANKLFDLIYK